MRKVYVVNCSPDVYNLACAKMANSFRRDIIETEVVETSKFDWFCNGDEAWFSCIFTKDIDPMIQMVNLALSKKMEVHVGGPAVTMTADYIRARTGVEPFIGLHPQFDREPGDYKWTFTSRGCPRNCPFCLVSQLEGLKIVEIDDFDTAPNIGDNNILMTSDRHQELVIARTLEAGFSSVDINSGFDCRVFATDPDFYYQRWSQLPLSMWRFALDGPDEEQPIRKVFDYLKGKGFDRHKVQAYVLCNFPGTAPAEVRSRAETILSYGMMPYLMVYQPVDSAKNGFVAQGWDKRTIQLMTGYFNQPSVWMSCSYEEFAGQSPKALPMLALMGEG